jgi:hypothetical protein
VALFRPIATLCDIADDIEEDCEFADPFTDLTKAPKGF